MTSITDAARALQTNRRRPASALPIVPAVPLPLVQKRSTQTRLAAAIKTEELDSQSAPNYASKEGEDDTSPVVNGHQTDHSLDSEPRQEHLGVDAERQEPTDEAAVDQGSKAVQEAEAQIRPQDQPDPPQHRHDQSGSQAYSTQFSSAPSSAGSGAYPQHPFHHRHVPFHHHQLSNGSIVFGAYSESSSSSPAALAPVEMHQYPVLLPGHIGSAQPKPLVNGHAPHLLTTHVNPVHHYPHPALYGSHELYFPSRAKYQYPPHHIPSFVPPDGPPSYLPSGRPADGDEPAPSVASSGHDSFRDQVHQSDAAYGSGRQPPPPAHGAVHSPAEPINGNMSRQEANGNSSWRCPNGRSETCQDVKMLSSLQKYFGSFYASCEFADCTLELRHAHGRLERLSLPAHQVMLGRSPTLKSLLSAGSRLPRTVRLEVADRFIQLDAFREALRYLYLGAMPTPNGWVSDGSSPQSVAHTLDFFLGYAAAGHVLRVPAVTAHGSKLAAELIDWETLERILSFAVEGGIDESLRGDHENTINGGDPPASETRSPAQTKSSRPMYGIYGSNLLDSATDFLLTNFPPQFTLDVSVPELAMHPRLPETADGTRPSGQRRDPRLKSMKFGDHPSEDDVRSDTVATVLSKVLLSAPFSLLKSLLESPRLGRGAGAHQPTSAEARARLAMTVVQERERRRKLALVAGGLGTSSDERADRARRWEALAWREYVAMGSGWPRVEDLTIERSWEGI